MRGQGLSVTCHPGVLDVTAVGFAPARELALLKGFFGPDTRHVIHPDQTRTYRQSNTGRVNWKLQIMPSSYFHSEVTLFSLWLTAMLHTMLFGRQRIRRLTSV